MTYSIADMKQAGEFHKTTYTNGMTALLSNGTIYD